MSRLLRAISPWLMVLGIGAPLAAIARRALAAQPELVWRSPRAVVLLAGALLVGVLGFTLRARRSATLAFSHTAGFGRERQGRELWTALPAALRVLALGALTVALARPQTYRIVTREVDSVDIMLVFDLSRSMEETDLPRDRLDAAQRVVRNFVRGNKNDRIGLVVFAQRAMLQCPLTHDSAVLEQIVADLAIGDVAENGTAIGDGLALALAQLRRSTSRSKVVILLSDGDSNTTTRFSDAEAARTARSLGVKVFTVLVGAESSGLLGGMSVNPQNLRAIASSTGGEFFRADDELSFREGFARVRASLDKTKRTRQERVPDRELFLWFVALALVLLGLELLLASTWLRRLP
ncbi:MAG: VWA domain-containing protein [Kofleriaceae bacterium]